MSERPTKKKILKLLESSEWPSCHTPNGTGGHIHYCGLINNNKGTVSIVYILYSQLRQIAHEESNSSFFKRETKPAIQRGLDFTISAHGHGNAFF